MKCVYCKIDSEFNIEIIMDKKKGHVCPECMATRFIFSKWFVGYKTKFQEFKKVKHDINRDKSVIDGEHHED